MWLSIRLSKNVDNIEMLLKFRCDDSIVKMLRQIREIKKELIGLIYNLIFLPIFIVLIRYSKLGNSGTSDFKIRNFRNIKFW